ncbi:hypothetical protein Nepgr_009404 [Nepenthes gracilis]|uniref:Uncharacterized protein n=1 Tax=Nepenthes gracilis TaxID=150966 RepID=A0AAD3SB81_NEPGR|nr:hypothetical protein Nepgr_009404 [Nepenthes gracilis]
MILVDLCVACGGFPRAPLFALMRRCTQKSHLPIGPSYEILCCGAVMTQRVSEWEVRHIGDLSGRPEKPLLAQWMPLWICVGAANWFGFLSPGPPIQRLTP